MRVTFLGHACHLVELDGVRVLTDPWLVDPIFEGHVERDPPLAFSVDDLPGVDLVALTHGHLDHFNAPTLQALARAGVPVVHPRARLTELDANLRRLGFAACHARADWEPLALGPVRVVPTPSLGVLDECAYLIEGPSGRFWNGADAPQVPEVLHEVARRHGPVDLGAFGHNSFNQPALLGLEPFKPADHGPRAGAEAARILGAGAAFAAASNMRWCGPDGASLTRRVIRRRPRHLAAALARAAPATTFLDLAPGDAWSRDGVERGALRGKPAPPAAHDYLHPFLGTGERHCPPGRPSVEDTFRRDLPARLRAAPEAARHVDRAVCFELEGEEAGCWTVDFACPDAPAERGDRGAPFAVRLPGSDWVDLFERRIPWQVLLASDRLRVTRVRRGPPPEGLHFVFALQAVFP